MPLNIEPPIEKEFVLEESDKILNNQGEPTTVVIIQAREGANAMRAELFKRFERKLSAAGEFSVAQEVNPSIVRRKDAFLTLKACNLTQTIVVKAGTDGQPAETKQEPLFKFPAKEFEFNKAWDLLPPVIADEIYRHILEVNPDWAASGEGL